MLLKFSRFFIKKLFVSNKNEWVSTAFTGSVFWVQTVLLQPTCIVSFPCKHLDKSMKLLVFTLQFCLEKDFLQK